MPVGTRGAVKYLSAADYEALGAEIVLGNTYHLMLRPGADVVARFGGLGALRRVGRPHADRLRRASRCSRSSRRSTTTASRSAASTTARSHRLTPESAVAVAGAARRRHPDGARRVPAAAEPARRRSRLAVERTAAWAARARAAHRRDGQSLFGIVQGGTRRGAAGRERPPHRRPSTSTATASAGCRWGRRRAEMLPALAAAIAHLPGRPAALPDGRRRPGVARRGRRRSASTSSTA